MSRPVDAYLGLGSNVGDRRDRLDAAVAMLRDTPDLKVIAVSSILETEPWGPVKQGNFLNAAVKLRTTLAPSALLETCLQIERAQGRDRAEAERWGPRTLDLDVLLYGDDIVNVRGLRIPHPRLHERAFVLKPLAEIAGSVWHPELEMSIQDLWARLETPVSGE